MRIGYVILAHRLPDQLTRLVRRLASPDSTFAVHVDSKSPHDVFDRVHEQVRDYPAVDFIDRRSIVWSGFGQVAATLDGLSLLRGRLPEIDCALLLSGQDYPIKPVIEIQRLLEQSRGRSFIEHFPLPWRHWEAEDGGYARLRYRRLEVGRRLIRVPVRRRIPGWLTPHGGAAYWCLSRTCIDYLLEFVAANPRFVRFFKQVRCPDELFFQSILADSPLAGSLVDRSLWFTEWSPGAAHPNVLGERHLEALAQSEALFARKFDSSVDERVLDLIDQRLL
jgi:hypothetical protein